MTNTTDTETAARPYAPAIIAAQAGRESQFTTWRHSLAQCPVVMGLCKSSPTDLAVLMNAWIEGRRLEGKVLSTRDLISSGAFTSEQLAAFPSATEPTTESTITETSATWGADPVLDEFKAEQDQIEQQLLDAEVGGEEKSGPTTWMSWISEAEQLALDLGVTKTLSLDSEQNEDHFSMDFAHDSWLSGSTPAEYIQSVVDSRGVGAPVASTTDWRVKIHTLDGGIEGITESTYQTEAQARDTYTWFLQQYWVTAGTCEPVVPVRA